MALQLGTCSRLRARITETQCHKNRHGVAANPKAGTRAVPACFSCQGCAGLIDVQPADYQPPVELPKPDIAPLIAERKSVENTQINVENTQKPVPLPAAQAKEPSMAFNKGKGNCPTCKRNDVHMLSAQKCARCYSRIAAGKDPITGAPVAPQKGPEFKTPDTPPSAPVRPAAAEPRGEAGTIDIHQVLDDAWQEQRSVIIQRLAEADSVCRRLSMAVVYFERIKELGV